MSAQRNAPPRTAKADPRSSGTRRPSAPDPGARDHAPRKPGLREPGVLESGVAGRASALAAGWAPTAARVLLGLVLAWFGYHELVQPALWTGYVPLVHGQSALAVLLVLAHGWVLLVLAVALVAGIMPRVAAGAAAILLLEIVVWLTVSAGLSDLTLRDVGVLGLAIGLTGPSKQRLTLTS